MDRLSDVILNVSVPIPIGIDNNDDSRLCSGLPPATQVTQHSSNFSTTNDTNSWYAEAMNGMENADPMKRNNFRPKTALVFWVGKSNGKCCVQVKSSSFSVKRETHFIITMVWAPQNRGVERTPANKRTSSSGQHFGRWGCWRNATNARIGISRCHAFRCPSLSHCLSRSNGNDDLSDRDHRLA